jgi:hypothetical protein
MQRSPIGILSEGIRVTYLEYGMDQPLIGSMNGAA